MTDKADQRPNILLIMADQHRWDCLGFEGRRNVRTPNIDALAARGTSFSAAITPNLVCQPARASILTGQLPLTHGVCDNQISLDPAVADTGWASTLSQNGYSSAFIGKAHFGQHPGMTPWGAAESRDDSEHFPADWSGPYAGFDLAELMIIGHWHKYLPLEKPPRGHHFERWFSDQGDWAEGWRLWSQNIGQRPSAAQTWFSALPAEWHSTTWVTERAISFIEAQKNQSTEPFCAWISYPDPHHSFDCPEPWSRRHTADDVDISTIHKRDFDRRPFWHEAAQTLAPQGKSERNRALRREYSRIPPQTDYQLAEITANYYGMIEFVDDGIGRILDALDQSGMAEDTLVIFTTDHGELLGDHGLYLKGPTPYEALLRVGLVAAGPGVAAGGRVDLPVSTLDLAPTFHQLAGVDDSSAHQGMSLLPLLAGKDQDRPVAHSEWYVSPARAGLGLQLRTVRTQEAKLTYEEISGQGELYVLSDDPDEMDNRWNDPGTAHLQSELLDLIASRPGPKSVDGIVSENEEN